MILETMSSPAFIAFAAAMIVIGYVVCRGMLSLLPGRLEAEHLESSAAIKAKAEQKAAKIVKEAEERVAGDADLMREELELVLEHRLQNLKEEDQDLNRQQQYIDKKENKTMKKFMEVSEQEQRTEQQQAKMQAVRDDIAKQQKLIIKELGQIAELDIEKTVHDMAEERISAKTIEAQKRLKDYGEQISSHSGKLAHRMLASQLSHYEPNFVWPKMVSHVEITKPKVLDALSGESPKLLEDLRELSEGVQIELSVGDEDSRSVPIVKFGGGYGIYKESARLTLEELIGKPSHSWAKVAEVYKRHCQRLEAQAKRLGQQAVRELKLPDLHPRIQYMVGALNWRTSYRQNQFHHSLEVAKLAGFLALELGMDSVAARRCGLLHDIGKGIDYRIEGSHAVISADYADRFGERKVICDTVMSHHNDLVLETPMSYVLKTADTLSGARPGARVNLEDGYQGRLSAIEQSIKAFPGITDVSIMNGGREVHIEVNSKRVKETHIRQLALDIKDKIEEDVAFPGQIKIQVTRRFEATATA